MKPQSQQAKVLKGTFRKSRGQTPADLPPDSPLPETAPDWLSRAAKGHYKRIRPQLDGIATAAAVDVLAAYAQDIATFQKISKQAVNLADLIEVDARDNERPSAISQLQNTIAARLLKGAKALALTPESRGIKAPPPKDDTPSNPWDSI